VVLPREHVGSSPTAGAKKEVKQKMKIDLNEYLPKELDRGRTIVINEVENNKIEAYVKKRPGKAGHDSKKVTIKRFVELDELFFEGLGLWQGEGGKDKGIYFGNTCVELLLHFLRFIEEKLGISRKKFKVTLNVPVLNRHQDEIKKEWSKRLGIAFENFTNVCIDPRINEEYAQMYFNSIVLSELMNNLHIKLQNLILNQKEFAIAYMKGIIAAEAQVALKKWGTIAYVAVSTIDEKMIDFYKKCLEFLDISSGTYQPKGRKFPIYGKKNLEKLRTLGLLDLHPKQKLKFENGFKNYQREIMKGEEMEKLILQQLKLGPKTYDDLKSVLNKGRSTIQSHYIPLLERKGFVKRGLCV